MQRKLTRNFKQIVYALYILVLYTLLPDWRVEHFIGGKCVTISCCNKWMVDFNFLRGVLPFAQRKRLWEKYRAKCRKQRPSTNQPDVATGSQVCMKNSPMYHPGAIAYTIAGGVPKVGQLQNSAWTLSDTCTFKIINVQSTNSVNTERVRDAVIPGTSGLSKFS